jgi:hypothetical protein
MSAGLWSGIESTFERNHHANTPRFSYRRLSYQVVVGEFAARPWQRTILSMGEMKEVRSPLLQGFD